MVVRHAAAFDVPSSVGREQQQQQQQQEAAAAGKKRWGGPSDTVLNALQGAKITDGATINVQPGAAAGKTFHFGMVSEGKGILLRLGVHHL